MNFSIERKVCFGRRKRKAKGEGRTSTNRGKIRCKEKVESLQRPTGTKLLKEESKSSANNSSSKAEAKRLTKGGGEGPPSNVSLRKYAACKAKGKDRRKLSTDFGGRLRNQMP